MDQLTRKLIGNFGYRLLVSTVFSLQDYLNTYISLNTIQDVRNFFFDQLYAPEHIKQESCRVLEKLAQQILLKNETIILNGKVKRFGIRRIGLGVCDIFLHEGRDNCVFE